jgi:predicted O-linked N-acetylglucosamine transferase (SPINDLY family)
MNRWSKIDEPQWNVWMQILLRAPTALLWLYAGGGGSEPIRWHVGFNASTVPAHVSSLLAEASARGVHPSRIVFAARAPRAAHLFRHYAADVQVCQLVG